MRHLNILAAALALSASASSIAAAQKPPTIAAAVAAQDRTADNVQLDRRPQAGSRFELPWSQLRHEGARSVWRQRLLGGN